MKRANYKKITRMKIMIQMIALKICYQFLIILKNSYNQTKIKIIKILKQTQFKQKFKKRELKEMSSLKKKLQDIYI